MTFLFLLASCSLFRGTPSLENLDKEKLLEAVKLTGEGKGRLTLGQSQYLFSVDSVLNESQDWILAVTIPLHGEEVMILPNLKLANVDDAETESFEARIRNEFKRLKLNEIITSVDFMKELRSLIRFNLAPQWGQKRSCKAQQSEFICEIDGEKYLVETTKSELKITKNLGPEKSLQLVAKNLTDSFFTQNEIRLTTSSNEKNKTPAPVSLELFW